MARVSGRASPTRLRRPQMHAMGVPHPPRSSPSRSPSRRYEGRHGPSAPQGQQGGTLASSTSSPRMTPLLHQDRVPKASDRTQLEAKEVRLSDMPPITLDDTDVQT